MRDKLGRFVKGNKEGFQKGHKSFPGTKKTRFKKGQTPWNKNKKNWMSEESKQSMIKKKTGQSLWPNGRIFSEKHKENISKAITELFKDPTKNPQYGKPNPAFSRLNKDPKFQKRKFEAMQLKPNKPEKIMINLIKENNLPFNYVGDGAVILGGFNPDFLSKNPKHIIEVFGDYWHNKPELIERDKRRLKTYSKYGYKTLIIWEHELKNTNQVLNKIRGFIIK